MLLEELVKKCDERYRNLEKCQCEDCEYGQSCPHDCIKCLEYVHFPDRAPAIRKYDCVNMADCYYCKYSYRYASEVIYGLEQFKGIREKEVLKVMSIGCGPCTELAGIDYLHSKDVLQYNKIEFRGIDPLGEMWYPIWEDINNYFGDGIKFYERNVLELVDIIIEKRWVPDLIIFQYVFSDMFKKNGKDDIDVFINKLAAFLNAQLDKEIYILANDINLSTSRNGGRDFFDELVNRIQKQGIIKKYHFNNEYRLNHFDYGKEYDKNEILFEIPEEIRRRYLPFDSCASAQVLIKKVKKKEGE